MHSGALAACRNRDVHSKNVLYGTDDYVGGSELLGLSRSSVAGEENAQLKRADLVIAITPTLMDRWRSLGFHGPMFIVPNGVDVDAYKELDKATSADIDLPHPIAGFVGHLSSRIDIRLMEAVVEEGCSLLLIGPCNLTWEPERFKALASNPRVRWVGQVEFERLSSFLKIIDVGITPYVDSEFNRASFPLKTLEYLAAGKPAVSTDLPAVRWLNTDLITVASRENFGRETLAAATAAETGMSQKRVEFASLHSWDRRARMFAEAIGICPASSPSSTSHPP